MTDPQAASAETAPVSHVAVAVDVVVVVAVAAVAVREKALWARRATAVPKAAATERLGRESPAGKSASTRNQRSAARNKVIVAVSRWPTVTIITMSTAKVGMSIMRTRATRRTGKSNAHTLNQSTRRSNPSEPPSMPASRRKPVSRANLVSLVRHASLGKTVSPESLANLASHDRSSTSHNPARVRHRANPLGRASTRRTSSVRRPLSPVSHVRQSRLSCGPQPRQATDATSNVS